MSLYRLLTASPERVIAERTTFAALGIAEFEVLPHLNRRDVSFLDRVARYAASTGRDVIALEDGAAIFLDGTGIPECVGRAVCYGPEGERGWTPGGTA